MQENNRDVFPTDATRSMYAAIDCLITNPILDEAFARHEALAVKAKRRYHRLGRFAIALIAFSSIYTLAEALILPAYPGDGVVSAATLALAGVGIVLQLYLIFTHQKEAWLVNRYAVERLRSLKFQSFQLAHTAQTSEVLARDANAFVQQAVVRLENELNAGDAVIGAFQPALAVDIRPSQTRPANADLASLASDAFLELRVAYQKRFAQSELSQYASRRRIFNSSQDMIYLFAAAFAFLSLGAKLLGQFDVHISTGWFDFFAVALFVLGATKSILDNASIEEQSETRFGQYVRDIDQIIVDAGKVPHLPRLVRDMELLCMQELDNFCRAAERISYRM